MGGSSTDSQTVLSLAKKSKSSASPATVFADVNATDTDGNRYWVAQCLAKSKFSEAVLHTAEKVDPAGA